MSHFSVAVFSHHPGDVEELLAPYNEQTEDEAYLEFEEACESMEDIRARYAQEKQGGESFEAFLRRWYGVYQVTPGLTGWAQGNGRDTVEVYDKVFYDREYVQNVGLKFDLKVLWKSVQVVLNRKGVVDGKIDPAFRQESIVLLRESRLVSKETDECVDEMQMV